MGVGGAGKDDRIAHNLKDSALLQMVREAATAFDVSTRCSSATQDTPREMSRLSAPNARIS